MLPFAGELPAEATAFLILFARVGAVLMLLPVFSDESAPGQVRLLLALGMSAALFGLLRENVRPVADAGDAALPGVLLTELAIGMALGTLVRFTFQAIAMAGSLVGTQIGLTSALVFDPSAGGQTAVLSRLLGLGAALVCFATGVHHLWIGAIVRSYALWPVGIVPDVQQWAGHATMVAGQSLELAVSLSAPFILYGILFNVALGFGARLAPALQIFFIAQPLNLLFGLALLAVTAGSMLSIFAERFGSALQSGWAGVG